MGYSDPGVVQYESLYGKRTTLRSGNYAKRRVRYRATKRKNEKIIDPNTDTPRIEKINDIDGLFDIYNNHSTFIFEEGFDQAPERVYDAMFEGQIDEEYTYQYTALGKSLTFTIIER